MSRTKVGELFESANTVDILFFVRDNPGCFKSEIYQNVTRNAHTRKKIVSSARGSYFLLPKRARQTTRT